MFLFFAFAKEYIFLRTKKIFSHKKVVFCTYCAIVCKFLLFFEPYFSINGQKREMGDECQIVSLYFRVVYLCDMKS